MLYASSIGSQVYSEIVINNVRRERNSLSRFACKSSEGTRKYPLRESIPDRVNLRPVFFHDSDKIIHSQAYSRYIDKTQAFFLFDNDHITHRVLHVQLVSKIGRVIGRCLRLNEDLIEAIALGHDLGHVPYGHDGETVLNEICEEENIGYFCHNAQSIRFIHEIEERGKGLNLSLQVLDGILAHNGEMISNKYLPERNKSWARFEEEYEACLIKKDYSKKIIPATLEGCVVRIADVIAYIGRDIEDAIELRIIKRKDIPKVVVKTLGNTNAGIINSLAMDLLAHSYDSDYLAFSKNTYNALHELKEFNMDKIYIDPRIKTQNAKIERMFRHLFKEYEKDLNKTNIKSPIFKYFLNDMSPQYSSSTSKKRIVIDFIAGMTDRFFNKRFEEITIPMSFGHRLIVKN